MKYRSSCDLNWSEVVDYLSRLHKKDRRRRTNYVENMRRND